MPFHVGLDWGGASHAACIVDETGRIVARLDVRHDATGLADMLARLKRVAPPAELPNTPTLRGGSVPGFMKQFPEAGIAGASAML